MECDVFQPNKVPRIKKKLNSEIKENSQVENYSQQMFNSLRQGWTMHYS